MEIYNIDIDLYLGKSSHMGFVAHMGQVVSVFFMDAISKRFISMQLFFDEIKFLMEKFKTFM